MEAHGQHRGLQKSTVQSDEAQCVMTRSAPPRVAHIVPHAVGTLSRPLRETQPDIQKLLWFLVSHIVVNLVTDDFLAVDVAHRAQINRLENLISLSSIVHEGCGKVGWY